ncbi:MAG: hypothetical protein Q9216_003587 [Gyalolechia sp. 2 TL-2023]
MSNKHFKSQASSSRAVSGAFAVPDAALGAFGRGFGAVPSSMLSYVYEPPDLSMISEPNVVVAFKNVQKKDSTTKAKALEELQKHILELVPKDGLENAVLEPWIKVYPRTSIDSARRVRQLAHQLQGAIANASGKKFARVMPDIVGPWLAGLFDGDKMVSNAAKESLHQVFSTEEKMKNVWTVYLGSILKYCSDAVFKETIQTLSDERTVSPDDAFAKHTRVVAAAIHVVRYMIDTIPEDALNKQRGALEDFLSRKELWKLSSHSDPSVRRSLYRLLNSLTIEKPSLLNMEMISDYVLVSSLSISQASSIIDYSRALARLTAYEPRIWTDYYKGTGKRTATKRLCQYLAKGSQGGPSTCWDDISSVFLNVPEAVLLPADDLPDQRYVVFEAMRDGITNREEPTSSQQSAWSAYLNLVKRFLSVRDVEHERLIESTVMPMLVHYITPSGETSAWTISASQQPILLDAARIALKNKQLLIEQWQKLSEALIQDIQTSLPEQAKDFVKSQDTISAKAKRWHNLQAVLRSIELPQEVDTAITDATRSEIQSAIALLKARSGKPYGAASLLESATRSMPDILSDQDSLKNTFSDFMMTNAPDLLFSPSGPYLIGLLPHLESIVDVGGCYRTSLQSVLRAPKNEAKNKALQRLMASSCLAQLDNNQELLANLTSNLQQAIDKEEEQDEIFRTAIANPHAPLQLTQDLITYMFDNLSVEEHQSASLDGLGTVARHKPDVLEAYDRATDSSGLLTRLISLTDSSEHAISEQAKSLSDTLQANTATDPSHSNQGLIKIIRRNLDRADRDSLSIASLVDLAHKVLLQCDEQRKATIVATLLPDEPRWKTALQHILRSRPNSSLAIMNNVGTAISLIEPPASIETYPSDKAGHSAAFRMFSYTGTLIQTTDILAYATIDHRACIYRYLALMLQIISDNLSIPPRNEQYRDSEEEVIDAVSQTQKSMVSWLANSTTDSSISGVLLGLLRDSKGLFVESYYSSRAYIFLAAELTEAHTNVQYGVGLDELRSVKNTADIFAGIAMVSAAQDLTTLTRMFNELLAELTGDDFGKQSNGLMKTIMLNSILDREEFIDVLFGIPKQRLIYFVQHAAGFLAQMNSPGSETRPASIQSNIAAELLRALSQILPALKETYGSFWKDCTAVLMGIWSLHTDMSDETIPLVHASLRLHSTLLRLNSGESNEDLEEALESSKATELGSGMIHLLQALQGFADKSHQPRRMVNELLARQISKAKHDITVAHSFDLFPALASESLALQGAAYELLHLQIPRQQENISLDKALSKDYVAKLPEELLSLVIDAPTVETLADANFKQSIPEFLQSYLLCWQLIFDHWDGASDAVKNDYVSNVKEGSYIDGVLGLAAGFLVTSRVRAVDASRFDVESYAPGTDIPEKDAQWLLTHLYYLALKHLPTLSKTWWRDNTSRQTQIAVESWTEKHISPLVIASELSAVSSWAANRETDQDQPLTVKVSTSTREVTASIPIDEQSMSLAINLPTSYPLSRATVSGVHRVGVTEQKWRNWIITTQGVINFAEIGGGGQLIDGLMAWRKNVTATLKGQTECAICYSVVSVDRQLPSKRCGTSQEGEEQYHVFAGLNGDDWFYFEDKTNYPSSGKQCAKPMAERHLNDRTISGSDTNLVNFAYETTPPHSVPNEGRYIHAELGPVSPSGQSDFDFGRFRFRAQKKLG